MVTLLDDCAEVRARAGGQSVPRIFHLNEQSSRDDLDGYRLNITAGRAFALDLRVKGGTAPFTWKVVAGELPEGVELQVLDNGGDFMKPAARIAGTAAARPDPSSIVIQITDADGQSDKRALAVNPADRATRIQRQAVTRKNKKELTSSAPPTDVRAVGNADSITLSWEPSADPDVVGYIVFRSDTPFDRQERRIYVADDTVTFQPGDQVVVEYFSREFPGPEYWPPNVAQAWKPALDSYFFDSRFVPEDARFELVEHPGKPLPEAFAEPGDSCLKVTQPTATRVTLRRGTFGVPLVAGSHVRTELWARQEGVTDGILELQVGDLPKKKWNIGSEWTRCEHEFDVGDEPLSGQVYLYFNGPGTLWLDDWRMYRKDEFHTTPDMMGKEAFEAFMAMQPATGRKGVMRYMRRIFDNESPMDSLLKHKWQNPEYSMNARGTVRGFFWGQGYGCIPTMLEWTTRTGDSPETRCVPHFTMRLEHGEEDWQHLVEYLAGPPESEYGAIRVAQRGGDPTPWTDEFREIIIEYSNESWHNGVIGGWTGWGIRGWIHGGYREQGFFARYFFDEAVGSMPLWKEKNLKQKIKFAINSNRASAGRDGKGKRLRRERHGNRQAEGDCLCDARSLCRTDLGVWGKSREGLRQRGGTGLPDGVARQTAHARHRRVDAGPDPGGGRRRFRPDPVRRRRRFR